MKKLITLLLAAMLMMSLCACGSSAKSDSYYNYESSVEAPAAMADYYYEPDEYTYAEEAAYGEAEMAGTTAGGFADNGNAAAAEASAVSSGDINTEKIIYSADASIETTDFDGTLEKLAAMVEQYGGFVESSSVSGNNYYSSASGRYGNRSASYQIRIPGKSFSTVMSSLTTLGNVPYSYTYTENITAQYYDTQARLEAYQAQEKSLIAMMEKAETVEDLITIENALTEVRYKLDSLQSTLTNWDRRVNYSTISLTISEVSKYTPEVSQTYGQKLVRAVRDGLESVGDFFAEFLLGLLEALPTLIILAVVIFVIVTAIRKSIRKRRSKKTEKPAENVETINK